MKKNLHITIVVGARPNFMKVAPIIRAINVERNGGEQIDFSLVHTGQHFDEQMSQRFFSDLGMDKPFANLEVGNLSQTHQAAEIMIRFEEHLIKHPTSLVLVVGDVTSTMACALVARKRGVLLAHVEAGIRSFDNTMPEEMNRKVTDCISDYFFTTSEAANQNLLREGINKDRIFFVGNVMIDTLIANSLKIRKPDFFDDTFESGNYMVLTMHRPNNVDDSVKLEKILHEIDNCSQELPVVFPVHPRTAKVLQSIRTEFKNIRKVDPLGYLEFSYLMKNAKAVITDSGGITEEATVLGIPCLTLRDNTEREETCTIGTNELIGSSPDRIKENLDKIFSGKWKKGGIPPLWDGKSSERIVQHLIQILKAR